MWRWSISVCRVESLRGCSPRGTKGRAVWRHAWSSGGCLIKTNNMKMSYRKHEPPIRVFISWVEFSLRAPARSPISQMQPAGVGSSGGRAVASLALSDSQRSQRDRSWLAFPRYPFSSINYSCKLPIRLWETRALIGKVTFLSVWQYWCYPFCFRVGPQPFMLFIISSMLKIGRNE